MYNSEFSFIRDAIDAQGAAQAESAGKNICGPSTRAFATLAQDEQAALRESLVNLWTSHNHADGSNRTVVDAEYLEVVGIRA